MAKKKDKGKLTFDQRSWELETMSQGALSGTGTIAFSKPEKAVVCPEHPPQAAWWWKEHGCAMCRKVEAAKMARFCSSPETMRHWPSRVRPVIAPGSLKPSIGGIEGFDSDDEYGPAQVAERERKARKQALLAEQYPFVMPRLGTDMIDRFTGKALLSMRILPILGKTFTPPDAEKGPWRASGRADKPIG